MSGVPRGDVSAGAAHLRSLGDAARNLGRQVDLAKRHDHPIDVDIQPALVRLDDDRLDQRRQRGLRDPLRRPFEAGQREEGDDATGQDRQRRGDAHDFADQRAAGGGGGSCRATEAVASCFMNRLGSR